MKTVAAIMMPRITTIICATLLLLPIFIGFTNAQDELLVCNIKDGENEIHLELRKTEQLLANEHLPVWSANSRKRNGCPREGTVVNQLIPNLVKDEIGHFIFYHDKEKSAAVVLFMKSKTLNGMIDTRYLIVDLPLERCNEGVEMGQYVHYFTCSTMNPAIHPTPLKFLMPHHGESGVETGETSILVPGNDGSITNFYPEIMVFVSHDITRTLKGEYPNDYHTMIVMQYLAYFNAIDMLLSKLSTDHIKIHLNLAGIVIEDQETTFRFLAPYYLYPQIVNAYNTYHLFSLYARQNLLAFSHDSFDFFFISTGRTLFSSATNTLVEGLAWFLDVYVARSNAPSTPVWPGAIVRTMCGYDYISGAHEIAHLIRIRHDPVNEGYWGWTSQCYAVMQEMAEYCPDCLRWSGKSVNDLEIYSSQNPDRCYLLNKPRSLHPYGTPIQTLTPSEQCRCYGFEPPTQTAGAPNSDVIPQDGCHRGLICSTELTILPLPIDGTPCANNGLCWDRVCRRIPHAP